MNDIRDTIKTAFLEQYKSKIETYDTIFDYFNDLKKSDLLHILSLSSLVNEDIFGKLILLRNSTKVNIVKYIVDNYEMIYGCILKNIEFKVLREMIKLFDHFKDEVIVITDDFSNYGISFSLLQTIDRLNLGKINYSSKKQDLTIMIPKDIRNLIISASKNDKFLKYINSFANLRNYTNAILGTYGVLPMDTLIKILVERFNYSNSNIVSTDFFRLSLLDDNINICSIDDDYLIYNLSFETEEEAYDFYYSLDEKLDYKIYSKKQYEDFYDFKILKKLDPYKDLISYLLCNYDMEKEDIEYFDDFCVIDYIYSYQLNEKVAKRNFNSFIRDNFSDCSINDKERIFKFISEITEYFPNFELKGRTISNLKKCDK